MNMGFVNDWVRRSQSSPFNPGGQKEALFLLYCDMVRNGDIEPGSTDSMDVVDNFYVNGDFIYRKDCSAYEWRRTCERAVVHNEEIAILKF